LKLDVEEVRRMVSDAIEVEGAKAVVKHEVEEVVWRVLGGVVDDVLESWRSRIDGLAAELTRMKMREEAVEKASEIVSNSILKSLDQYWGRERVEKLIVEGFERGFRRAVAEEVHRRVSEAIDRRELERLVKKEAAAYVKAEVAGQWSLLVHSVEDLMSRVSRLEAGVRR